MRVSRRVAACSGLGDNARNEEMKLGWSDDTRAGKGCPVALAYTVDAAEERDETILSRSVSAMTWVSVIRCSCKYDEKIRVQCATQMPVLNASLRTFHRALTCSVKLGETGL